MNYFDEPEDVSGNFEDWQEQVETQFDGCPDNESEFPETIVDFDLDAFDEMYPEGRTRILFSVPDKEGEQWRDFVETLTGEKIKRGTQSASSPLATLALRLLMAIVADYKVKEVGSDMIKLVGQDRKGLIANLEKVIEVLNGEDN